MYIFSSAVDYFINSQYCTCSLLPLFTTHVLYRLHLLSADLDSSGEMQEDEDVTSATPGELLVQQAAANKVTHVNFYKLETYREE